ncbi:glycoprotein UL100 [Cynomolgus macaque cytomegalovirus strain Ottawa]|uniref:Glycoprotein UL100 n=1 Tax=macacine betaherpesvirus 8 TaxID=2560567 RepID=G8H0M4_9BETA|nr:glycoprotein UL100 [Cynomolgus macaque cytomegalovirus strain Ottawa]AEQ32222.1 glycoprotein UL100 [Cynomolgus macaque cytomegalovirus strain Ottawa]
MATSKVDWMNSRIWGVSVLMVVFTFINLDGHVVMMNIPGVGYPCAYFNVVDYSEMNMSNYNVMHLTTPMLFLDTVQIIMYVAFSMIVFLCVVIYYICCWMKISYRKEEGLNLNQRTRDIAYMGDSLSTFIFILVMDTFELFTLAMSFRLPSVIAFMACLHFFCITIYNVNLVTNYQNFKQNLFSLQRIHPKLKGTIQYRTLIVNLVQMLLGFNIAVISMSLCLGFGNNFFVQTGHMVMAVFFVFAFISIIYFLLLEVVFYRYVKVQFGFHVGTFCGLCGLIYPIIKYELAYTPDYTSAVAVAFAINFLIWAGFTACRCTRYFRNHHSVKYKHLPATDELASLKEASMATSDVEEMA